jgi:hypothetical protein
MHAKVVVVGEQLADVTFVTGRGQPCFHGRTPETFMC